MRRGSPPRSAGALASRVAPALGDQVLHEAALATSAPELLLHASQELPAGLEHYPPAIDPSRELVPWLDAEGTAHRGGQHEPALGSEAKRTCHSLRIMARGSGRARTEVGARPAGFEPAASCSGGTRSIH